MDPTGDPAFRALVEQAKRVCARHPDLLPFYLTAIREKARGMSEADVQALVETVEAGARPGR